MLLVLIRIASVVGTHQNRLAEAILMSTNNICLAEVILMSTNNICFYGEL